MRKVVSEIGSLSEDFEVGICDKCGREATEELTLVPKKKLMGYLDKHLSVLSGKLEEVQKEIEPVPEPSIRLERDIKQTRNAPAVTMSSLGYMGYTSTAPFMYGNTQTGSHTVNNYIYEELDADEEELVKIAETLEGRRRKVMDVAREMIDIIERMQRLSIVEKSFDLCEECYDRDYKWGEE